MSYCWGEGEGEGEEVRGWKKCVVVAGVFWLREGGLLTQPHCQRFSIFCNL